MAYTNYDEFKEELEGGAFGAVYLWTNLINGNQYVGRTVDLMKREKEHINGKGNKSLLYKAICKYGEENFKREILDVAYSNDELNEKEIYYIDKLGTYKNGYNQTIGGATSTGYKHTEETRKKMRENHANFTGENHPCYGKPRPDVAERNKQCAELVRGSKNPNFKSPIKVTNKETGEFVGIYCGAKEIINNLKSTKGKKLIDSHIYSVVVGKLNHHGGYFYERVSMEEYEEYKEGMDGNA